MYTQAGRTELVLPPPVISSLATLSMPPPPPPVAVSTISSLIRQPAAVTVPTASTLASTLPKHQRTRLDERK